MPAMDGMWEIEQLMARIKVEPALSPAPRHAAAARSARNDASFFEMFGENAKRIKEGA